MDDKQAKDRIQNGLIVRAFKEAGLLKYDPQ